MEGHWKLVNSDNEITYNIEWWDKNWRENIPKATQAMVMLGMITFMPNHESSSAEGEIMLINDNKLWNKEANEKLSKTGNRENDAGRIVAKIKQATCS